MFADKAWEPPMRDTAPRHRGSQQLGTVAGQGLSIPLKTATGALEVQTNQ